MVEQQAFQQVTLVPANGHVNFSLRWDNVNVIMLQEMENRQLRLKSKSVPFIRR